MDNFKFAYPCPLSIGFHCWEDQCAPLLHFTCFKSVPWSKCIKQSILWSEPYISSVLFAGTRCGMIISYKVYSCYQKIIDVIPLCFIFAHNEPINSIISASPYIYRSTVASLSQDGTFSLF